MSDKDDLEPKTQTITLPKPRNLAEYVKQKTNANQDQIDFYIKVATGQIPEASVKDRLEANKMLLERGSGKTPELVANLNVDIEQEQFDAMTPEQLMALLENNDDQS